MVERLPPKEEVASSSLVSRSRGTIRRRGQVAKAEVCKTSIRRFESARRLHTTQFESALGFARRLNQHLNPLSIQVHPCGSMRHVAFV